VGKKRRGGAVRSGGGLLLLYGLEGYVGRQQPGGATIDIKRINAIDRWEDLWRGLRGESRREVKGLRRHLEVQSLAVRLDQVTWGGRGWA
jgi:hypothetical protein